MDLIMEKVKHGILKLLVVLIYIISHTYDYVSYPIYWLYYHPWRVRRYADSIHAVTELRSDSVVYKSVVKPSKHNITMQRNGLITMAKLFRFVSQFYDERQCFGTREILAEEDELQPNGKVFKKFVLGTYKWITYKEFGNMSVKCGNGLRRIGLKSQDRVAILAETRKEWLISICGCFFNNFTVVTLYNNIGKEGILHGLNETKVELLICSNETWSKVKSVLNQTPNVKHIIIMESLLHRETTLNTSAIPSHIKITPFLQLLKDGETEPASDGVQPTPDDVAIIMYTSGSTGNPKGVMLSHRNLIFSISALVNVANLRSSDRYIAYLPLAHVLELLAESVCLLMGIKLGYSSSLTLTNKSSMIKAGSKGDANVFHPTLMSAVPLVLERIYKSIVDTMRRQGWAVEELFHYFVRYKMKWQDRGFDTPLLNKTLFRKVRYFLGGRVRFMLCGGAPLANDTQSLTRTCICVPVMVGYGLTETTACATITSIHDRSTGRAGAPLMNVCIKLVDWEDGGYRITDHPQPRGEIHIGGDNVAYGYFDNPTLTAQEFYEEDDKRWFRTGDIGTVDPDGVLRIIDRKKDLVKLQHGEYLSYGKIEAVLKTCPLVDNICMYADPSKMYPVAIVRHDKEITNADGSKLTAKGVARTLAEYGILNGLSKFEIPAKVTLVTDGWTPDSGFLTAAFKIKRLVVVNKYRSDIDRMYDSE